MGFDLNSYELVEDRIKKFYEKYPDGRIITEPLNIERISEEAFFRADIWNSDVLLSTGYAYEKAGQGYVNKTSWVENCETSAIGRALANMGLHGNKRPSREEMEKVERMTEKETQENDNTDDDLKIKIEKGKAACIEIVNRIYTSKQAKVEKIEEINAITDLEKIKEEYQTLKQMQPDIY